MSTSLILDLPSAEYHAQPDVSNSNLKDFAKSPAHYKHAPRRKTKAMELGTLLHTLVLEPEQFDGLIAVEPKCDKRTKEGKLIAAEFAAQSVGKIIATEKEAADVAGMAASIRLHKTARKILGVRGRHEASAFTTHAATGLRLRSRFDILPDEGEFSNAIGDIKTAEDASSYAFGKSAHTYRYHVQHPFYLDNLARAGEQRERFVFIVVEKEPPYAVATYELDSAAIELGRETYEAQLRLFAECVEYDSWPAYSQDLEPLSLPAYAFKPKN